MVNVNIYYFNKQHNKPIASSYIVPILPIQQEDGISTQNPIFMVLPPKQPETFIIEGHSTIFSNKVTHVVQVAWLFQKLMASNPTCVFFFLYSKVKGISGIPIQTGVSMSPPSIHQLLCRAPGTLLLSHGVPGRTTER